MTATDAPIRPELGGLALGMYAQAEVRRVARALASSGITALVLSGPPIHIRLHGGTGEASAPSLELLVPRSQERRALDVLFVAGWDPVRGRAGERWETALEREGFEVRVRARLGSRGAPHRLLLPLERALWADARPGPEGLLEPGPVALGVLLLASPAGAGRLPGAPSDLDTAIGSAGDLDALERLAARCRLRGALRHARADAGRATPGAPLYDGAWGWVGRMDALVRAVGRRAGDLRWNARIRAALGAARGDEPVEGRTRFRGLELRYPVGVVFPPRAVTEPLVDLAIGRVADGSAALVVDVGTGSGAVALSVARERPAARVLGIDVSREAVACARRNAARLMIPNARFVHGNLLEGMPASWIGRVSVIASNVPFVAPRERDVVRRHGFPEGTAIGPGVDGLGLVRKLLVEARDVLEPGGRFVAQLVPWHWDVLRPLMTDLGFTVEELRPSMGAMLGSVRRP